MTRALVLLLLLVISGTANAQQRATPLLPPDTGPGDRLTVYTADGNRVGGRLLIDNDGALVLRSDGAERWIKHADVRQVDRHRNRFLFGPLIGLAAGLAVGLPLRTRLDNEGAGGDTALAMSVVAGVGLGTIIDLFNGEKRTVYEAKQGGSRFDLVFAPGAGLSVGIRRTF
jgi:hypothetical protein